MSYFEVKWIVHHTVNGLQTFGGMFSSKETWTRDFTNHQKALDFYEKAKPPKKLVKLTTKEELEAEVLQ